MNDFLSMYLHAINYGLNILILTFIISIVYYLPNTKQYYNYLYFLKDKFLFIGFLIFMFTFIVYSIIYLVIY